MKSQLPGYKIYEYLLVLNPHEELRTKILQVKQAFYDKYEAPNALWGKPHITLVNFLQLQLLEERIINKLYNISMGYYPFKVDLKDFGSFPSHTIFIIIVSKSPIQDLVKEIRQMQRIMKLDNDNKPHLIMEPHLTIARKLLPWQYEKGWLEYSQKHFSGSFIADSMLLLKRLHGQSKYEVVRRFEFMNLPIHAKQGDLFA